MIPVMPRLKTCLGALALAVAGMGAAHAQSVADQLNDYPTVARADYIFACMAANGQSRRVLEQCACSIDLISTILPYDDYVAAETVLSMRRDSGERMSLFRSAAMASTLVAELRRAQAESEVICF